MGGRECFEDLFARFLADLPIAQSALNAVAIGEMEINIRKAQDAEEVGEEFVIINKGRLGLCAVSVGKR